MYETVLVADRGQSARRVVRTIRAMGIKAVAVYAESDARSRHVHEADEAVLLGAGPGDAPYRDVRALLEAAQRTGCRAVHPGCGPLAGSPFFAGAVEEAGLAWIGPQPRSMTAALDADVLAGALATAGVPYAGGPGRSLAAVTVLAGGGQVVALEPRAPWDAAALVVESPAPGLDGLARSAVLDVAAAAARAVDLTGLATVVVAVDARSAGAPAVTRQPAAVVALWPALDLGHPVVEALSGADLVEQQVRLAAGRPLRLPEPPAGVAAAALAHLRAPGTAGRVKIARWSPPRGEALRVDSGYAAGDVVPAGVSRQVATLCTWAASRDLALQRLAAAVTGFEAGGVEAELRGAVAELVAAIAARREVPPAAAPDEGSAGE